MNDTTPPPGTPGASGAPGAPSGPGTQTPHDRPESFSFERTSGRFFSWIRGLGIERSSDRWFAGVAGGIAAKAGIDPLIVRGIFVVLAVLGGPGILLYLAAWLLLPDHTGRIHLEDLFRGRASAGAIVTAVVLGAILFVPAVVWVFRTLFLGPWGWDTWGIVPEWVQVTFGVIWWALVIPGLIVWLIIWLTGRSREGAQGASGAQAASAAPGASGANSAEAYAGRAQDFADRAEERATTWAQDFERKAESWGQRVEDKSKEWDRRGREYHAAHRLGAAHIVLTLALTLLAASAAAGIALTNEAGGMVVLTAGLVAGVSVLAISVIVAGIRGRDSGWIGFLSFCGVVALFFAPFSTLLPGQTDVVPFGNSVVRPDNIGDDQAIVSIAGNATVDLSDLGHDALPRSIDVWLLGGNATVRMPESTRTRVQVSLMAGTIRDQRAASDERRQGGILLSRLFEQRATGLDDSDVVTVRVRVLGGNVNIKSAEGASSQSGEDRTNEIEQLKERIAELEQAR